MHNHFAVTDIFQVIVKGDDKTKFTWPMEQNICTGACTEVSDTYRCVLFIGPLDRRCEICGETFIDGLIRGGGYQVPGLFTHGAFRNTSYPSGQCKIVLTQGIAVCKGLQCSRVRHEGHLQMAMFQHWQKIFPPHPSPNTSLLLVYMC